MSAVSSDRFVKTIAKQAEDFPGWYNDVVLKAELADYSPVKGCMIIRPYGYALWESMRDELDRHIKRTGHSNVYFPLFVPRSLLEKEAQHVEGFNPQVAWVTHAGGKELDDWLAIRPTSEAIIADSVKDWMASHSSSSLPPAWVTHATCGLKPSTCSASFSSSERGTNSGTYTLLCPVRLMCRSSSSRIDSHTA